MNTRKHLCLIVRLALPGVGFVLASLGVYFLSLHDDLKFTWRILPTYAMVGLGFLAMLVGVFWAICRSMKIKMYQRRGHERHIQVFTIERPNCFPPSYEESQVSPHTVPDFVVATEGVDVTASLAPPLYSRDSSEAPDCTWSWERPPIYSQVEHIQQRVDSGQRRDASSEQ